MEGDALDDDLDLCRVQEELTRHIITLITELDKLTQCQKDKYDRYIVDLERQGRGRTEAFESVVVEHFMAEFGRERLMASLRRSGPW